METRKSTNESNKMNYKWTLSYRLNDKTRTEKFEFKTVAIFRQIALESMGLDVTLHQI